MNEQAERIELDATRQFTPVVADRPSFIPPIEQVEQQIPRDHPRISFRPGDFERLKAKLDQPAFREIFAALKAGADSAMDGPLPEIVFPPDFYNPKLGSWDSRYAGGTKTIEQNKKMVRAFEEIGHIVEKCALVYRLTGETAYRDLALRGAEVLASLDMKATSYHNTHSYHGVIFPLSVALDYLWDEMTEVQRERIQSALVARAKEFYPLSLHQSLSNPRDSHAISYGAPAMSYAALALYHHEPDARKWMQDLLTFVDQFPGRGGFGGDDGGWAQGFGYGDHWSMQRLVHMLYVATGVNFFQIPWAQNNGQMVLYFQPPYGNCPNFGDASYCRPKNLQEQVMDTWARVHQNPYYQWFADQLDLPPKYGQENLLSLYLYWPDSTPAKAPDDLPQAIHLRDTDWVAMHSHLADAERNVMLQFKSSPFGSWNHSHADQNSFVLEAFGKALLIDSGYYPWYGSPHDRTWTRQTRAHNALLFNGKGQGVWNAAANGRIIAFAHTEDFDYTAGDATAAYQQQTHALPELCAFDQGVQRAVRHVVFARPNVFVILDDVQTEKPASIQFLLHAWHRFDIDEARRILTVTNQPAQAQIHLLEPGPVAFSQTDQFSAAPEQKPHFADRAPDQWHLTCSLEPTTPARRLLTVIVVGRESEAASVQVERLESENRLGARIGDTTVEFELDGQRMIVHCRKPRSDGTPIAYTLTGPRTLGR